MKYIYSEKDQEMIERGFKAIKDHEKHLLKRLAIEAEKFNVQPEDVRKAFIMDNARLGLYAQQSRMLSVLMPVALSI